MCPAGAGIFDDLDEPRSEVSKLVTSGKAKPLLFAGVKYTGVYYIPSVNEPDWGSLITDENFLAASAKRRRDLPPVKRVL